MKNLTIRKSTIAKLNTNSDAKNYRTTTWGTQMKRTTTWGTQY